MCPGNVLFNSDLTEGMYDSGCGVAAAGGAAVAPDEAGGQLTWSLIGFLPEAAMRLWTTADANDAAVSTG